MTHSFPTSATDSSIAPGRPHLVLVGLPGSGKTTVGAMLAARLGRAFLDFDEEIERREGRSVTRIFDERGESAFRQLERELTADLRAYGNMVLSPGGGWASDPSVVGLIRPPAVMVYLAVGPETALKRLGAGSRARPLLSGQDPLGRLRALLEARRGAYESSDLSVDTELITSQEVTEEIIGRLRVLEGA